MIAIAPLTFTRFSPSCVAAPAKSVTMLLFIVKPFMPDPFIPWVELFCIFINEKLTLRTLLSNIPVDVGL